MATLKVTNIKNESFAGDQLYLKTDGKIGIGTGSPSDALEISHASDPAIRLHYGSNSGYSLLNIDSSNNLTLDVDASAAGSNSFCNLKIDGSEKLRITSDGNVGIGTTSPLYPLHLKNAMSSSPYWIHMEVSGSNTTGGGAGIAFDTSATNQASNNGLFLATVSGERSASANGSNTLVFKTSKSGTTGDGSLTSGPKTQMVITEDGNVGIGTTSPTNKLEISGGLVRCLGTASARFTVNNGAAEGFFGWNSGTLYLGGASALLNIAASGSNNIQLETNSSTRMTIKSDGDIEVGGNFKTNNLTGKNLIINGNFAISQRGTSSTDQSYMTVDRFSIDYGGHDEVLTQSQHALTSSDTGPWEKGFRYSYHIQNGNQTSGADAADYIRMVTRLEAQDLANSGWHYTNSNSYATLSFWVKSSVAQTFYGQVFSQDGSPQNFPFSTGALSANTWTKVEIKIPGGTNVQFDNNNKQGMVIYWWPFGGTNYTGSPSLNTWAAFSSGNRIPDMTSTWWTTNDATFELTGIQLEVGSIATEFEDRSYGEELARCQRYYQRWKRGYLAGNSVGTSDINIGVPLTVPLRTVPTVPALNMHRSGNKTVGVTIVSYEYSDANSIIFEVRVGNWTGSNAVVDEVAYVLIPSGDTMELNAEL